MINVVTIVLPILPNLCGDPAGLITQKGRLSRANFPDQRLFNCFPLSTTALFVRWKGVAENEIWGRSRAEQTGPESASESDAYPRGGAVREVPNLPKIPTCRSRKPMRLPRCRCRFSSSSSLNPCFPVITGLSVRLSRKSSLTALNAVYLSWPALPFNLYQSFGPNWFLNRRENCGSLFCGTRRQQQLSSRHFGFDCREIVCHIVNSRWKVWLERSLIISDLDFSPSLIFRSSNWLELIISPSFVISSVFIHQFAAFQRHFLFFCRFGGFYPVKKTCCSLERWHSRPGGEIGKDFA